MKVYMEYEEPNLPDDPCGIAGKKMLENQMKYFKYLTKWQLRSLENEIKEQGGSVTVYPDGAVQLQHFTPELTDKIRELLLRDEE